MDSLVTSRETWREWHHHVHHHQPWNNDDRQRLFGSNAFMETMNIIYTVCTYWVNDFMSFLKYPTLRKISGIIIRFTLLLTLPLNALVGTVLSLGCFANYCALLAHSIPVHLETSNGVLKQIRTSIDLFPHSHLAIFFTGALNNHCVHHVYPSVPRALHPQFSDRLRSLLPSEYRYVDSFPTFVALFLLRHEEFEDKVINMDDLPQLMMEKLPKCCIQVCMDVVSLMALVAVTYVIPLTRLFSI